MIVKHILQTKPTGLGVVFVEPQASIADAAKLLAQHRIGALVVVEPSGAIAGILSERDIVRGVGESGDLCLTQKVSDLMTCNVLTCVEQDSIDSLMQTMTERRIRHLPVVDGAKKLIGIVTIGDVVKSKLEMAKMEVDGLRDYVAAVR